MRELSLHILDIAQNSVAAGAKNINIKIRADTVKNILAITVTDDGCGMDKELLGKAADPFTTTRKTRKIGLGLPLFKMAALISDGGFDIKSIKGGGTAVSASFRLDHIDRMPLGDLGETMLALITGSPAIDFVLDYGVDTRGFVLDTREIKASLDGVPADTPEIAVFLKQYISENIALVNENVII